jgi:streptomycin 6-kinase
MSTLSEAFRRRVTSVWGAAGKEWLDRLPTLITTCAERWALSIQSSLPDLSYNFVAFAVTRDGTEVVLKLGVPNPELTTEIDALRAFQGGPVVELLEADDQLGALLIRRLVPGTPLSHAEDDKRATVIGVQLIRDLPIAEPSDHQFPTIGDWGLAFDRLRARFDGETGPLPSRMVDKAEELLQALQASTRRKMLLHGDLHHDNILSNGEDDWVAIDPKGVIGDPAYEAARFQHNPIPRFLSMDRPRMVAQRRVEILASILREDRSRLLAWAFVDAMLAACWSIEDNEDNWGYSLSCAELFDGMVG